MLLITIIKLLWVLLLMKQDCKLTDVITSLNKEDSKKVYNYLVGLEAKTTTENLDLENLLSRYQQDDAKYAEVVNLPIDNALKIRKWLCLV
jgi:hypothetical protein